jgi:hypothetical protein
MAWRTRAQVLDMVAELSARHVLPREVVEVVAARTGGVPLFVEEVTRLLLERGRWSLVVAHERGAAAAGRHRASISIGQRYLKVDARHARNRGL